MPPRNSIKEFAEDCYYHVYNRGVEKREIFLDGQDYNTFVYNLKRYLEPGFEIVRIDPHNKKPTLVTPNQVLGKVTLLAFCLMPNHFHLILKLKEKTGISELMQKVCTNYTTYFNDKYDRVGSLFQGVYKAVLVETEEQLNHLSRYIHLNPADIANVGKIENYLFSSLYYIHRNKKEKWFDYSDVIGNSSEREYSNFVLSSMPEYTATKAQNTIRNLLLE